MTRYSSDAVIDSLHAIILMPSYNRAIVTHIKYCQFNPLFAFQTFIRMVICLCVAGEACKAGTSKSGRYNHLGTYRNIDNHDL